MARQYNNPAGGSPSNVGNQLQTFYYQKQALIEARKEQYFSQLADTTSMPKNMGKKIKRFHYIPLLDDANINDQGIDAAGVTISNSQYFVKLPEPVFTLASGAAATTAVNAINAIEAGVASAAGAVVTVTKVILKAGTAAQANAVTAAVPGSTSRQGSGNLYGSTKDVGTISGKLPVLSETGGRVNRVGFKRKELEGSFEKFGFFDEYTRESMDFDTDAELEQHVNREMVAGANEITEDALQIDLLNSAGVIKYAGDATKKSELDDGCIVGYGDLMRLSIDLDNNRTPKHTKVVTGTRLIDTKTIPSARVLYIGSELLPTVQAMKDLHGERAFVSIEKYGAATDTLTGEAGAIDRFRLIVVPEMMKWAGAGAPVTPGDTDHYDTNGRYDVFPMLCIGDSSFTTIGFQTDGKSVKFKITHKEPGEATADRTDPYGETGFMSIKWYYGFMILRSERIGLVLTVAKL